MSARGQLIPGVSLKNGARPFNKETYHSLGGCFGSSISGPVLAWASSIQSWSVSELCFARPPSMSVSAETARGRGVVTTARATPDALSKALSSKSPSWGEAGAVVDVVWTRSLVANEFARMGGSCARQPHPRRAHRRAPVLADERDQDP